MSLLSRWNTALDDADRARLRQFLPPGATEDAHVQARASLLAALLGCPSLTRLIPGSVSRRYLQPRESVGGRACGAVPPSSGEVHAGAACAGKAGARAQGEGGTQPAGRPPVRGPRRVGDAAAGHAPAGQAGAPGGASRRCPAGRAGIQGCLSRCAAGGLAKEAAQVMTHASCQLHVSVWRMSTCVCQVMSVHSATMQ